MKYIHRQEDSDLGYSLRERVLEHGGRTVLYLISELCDEHFTIGCGAGMVEVSRAETRTVYVKGYVVRWKHARDEHGCDVSELEPIGESEHEALRGPIRADSSARFVYFEGES